MTPRSHEPAFVHLSDFGRSGAGIDRETAIKSAYDSGYQSGMEDGRAEAQADCELRLTEAGLQFETRRHEDREQWNANCADVLAGELQSAISTVVRHVEDHVATLLRPWLVEQVRKRAMDDLEKAIARALSDGVAVNIEAPADVLVQLRSRLSGEALKIEYVENASPAIRARVGETELYANVSAWIAELEAAAL